MKSSIGNTSPESTVDQDQDGVPDQAERDFAEDGRPAGDATPRARRPKPSEPDDDGGLASSRQSHGDVVPPPSN